MKTEHSLMLLADETHSVFTHFEFEIVKHTAKSIWYRSFDRIDRRKRPSMEFQAVARYERLKDCHKISMWWYDDFISMEDAKAACREAMAAHLHVSIEKLIRTIKAIEKKGNEK